ncbi:MAG TPA: energy transducer TonB [Bryobacteraceae bacterium]|jgi:TonB family protein|nr:energy transducer TonB [Bryobacteraceae bacterium]
MPVTSADSSEVNLLPPWREPLRPGRLLGDAAASILINAAIFAFFVFAPEGERRPQHRIIADDFHKAVHLVMPRYYEPTQKEPNKGKVSRELDVNSIRQAPERQAPRLKAPAPAPGPAVQTPPPKIPPPLIEPPKIEVAQAPPPPTATALPQPPVAVPVPHPPAKPRLAFEDVASVPVDPVAVPNQNGRARSNALNPGANGTVVGDLGDSSATFQGDAQNAVPGRVGSNLQLLSDAKGVDFKPYMMQVLLAVRRNWLAIIPESARMGRRGRVLIQFAIDRNGGVPKLVIAEGTGTDSLDRAAVAAVSASYPFPPLPAEYKGDQIRLQMAFGYNMPVK